MSDSPAWLSVVRGTAPLIVSMPHTGTEVPAEFETRLASAWLATKDADFWVHRLYDFIPKLGATSIRTKLSRSVIDMNRDPSGISLYPGQNTTELCPTTTFDGEPLYKDGQAPDEAEIGRRRSLFFAPYHATLRAEIDRLRAIHGNIVLFEAHSIRSRIPRLFDGELSHMNIGTNSGASCATALTGSIEHICDGSGFSRVTNGRFKGGYTTRHYGNPKDGVHAVQLELAMRSYMDEPEAPEPENWPQPYVERRAAPLRAVLHEIFETCLQFVSAS